MMRWCVSASVALLLAVGTRAGVKCAGEYTKHLQGIAVEESGDIFWSFTVELVKTDGTGRLVKKISVPNHYGDLALHGGKVYVAVNLGRFNQEAGLAKSWVYVHDAESLTLLAKHEVPEVVHGAGGIEWHDGHFYVVGGLPTGHEMNYVYQYTEDFTFVQRHEIRSGYTRLGIQTVCRGNDGNWWFGCYGKPAALLRTDDSFKLLGMYDYNAAVGIARIPDSDATFFTARSLGTKGRMTADLRKVEQEALTAKVYNTSAAVSAGKGWELDKTMPKVNANQAATASDTHIYGISNRTITKYDRATGRKLASSHGSAHHLNSGFFWDGKLYCAHSNFPDKPDRSDIKVLEPATMELTMFKDFGESDGSLTWAVRHDRLWWCCFAFYGKANTNSYVACFNEDWSERQRWRFPSLLYPRIGSASFSGGIWWRGDLLVSGHDHREVYRLRPAPDSDTLAYLETLPTPFAGQGFAIDPVNGGLIGIDRKAKAIVISHPFKP